MKGLLDFLKFIQKMMILILSVMVTPRFMGIRNHGGWNMII